LVSNFYFPKFIFANYSKKNGNKNLNSVINFKDLFFEKYGNYSCDSFGYPLQGWLNFLFQIGGKPLRSQIFCNKSGRAGLCFLKILGNFLVVQDVLIEYKAVNILVAGTVIFSLEGQIKVASRKVKKGFYCSTYGANFDINGRDKNIYGQGRLTIKKAASVNREYFEDNQLGFCLTYRKMLRITGIESRFGVIRETDEKTIL
jgi:hypothetical protein